MASHLLIIKLTRCIAVLLGVILLAVAAGSRAPRLDELGPAAAPAAAQASAATVDLGAAEGVPARNSQSVADVADLFACPTLRRGMTDPVNRMRCVWLLQVALHDRGYPRQRRTGFFGAQTRANVLDVQRRHGIPQTGNFGPLTRAALLGGGTAEPPDPSAPPIPSMPPIPPASPSSYIGHLCSFAELNCSLYLRRSTTERYAQALEDHKQSATAAAFIADTLLGAACTKVFRIGIVAGICGVVANRNVTDIQNALRDAGWRHACLRVTVGLPARKGTWRLVAADADNSARCTD
jgi:peptidoglycan hydrolase-like protein with peptidoglycan-binding domain